jgi:site-specific DNA recombinase
MAKSDNGRRIRVAIYCRISLARHGDQVKVERQEELCRKLCKRLGWEVAAVFVDNSRSAWKRNRKRPGWDALLAGVVEGRFDAIVVYHGDRLIRQPFDLETLLNLADKQGIHLASPTGTRNLDSADDRYILRIEVAAACRESDRTSQRVRDAKEARRAAGAYSGGGARAFGRNRDGSIVPAEAKVIREVLKRLVAGETPTSLWRELNARGIPSVAGKPWRYGTFRQMLQRPDLAGLVAYQGAVVGKGKRWKPIVSRELWEAAQGVLDAKRAEYPGRPEPRKYLLSSIATCGTCGQKLSVGPTSTPRAYRYRCVQGVCAKRVARSVENLDAYVIGYVLTRLADPRLWQRLDAAGTDDGAGVELAAIEARRGQVAEEFGEDDEMDPALLRKMLAKLDARAAEVRARIEASRSVSELAGLRGLNRAGWDALPLDRRRAVVRRLVTVSVGPSRPGPGFDEASVQVRSRKVR